MTDIYQAMADPTRRALLDRLSANGGQTLTQLCDGFAISRQAISKHLAVLEKAELVVTAKQGRKKLHYLNPVPLAKIARRWLGRFEEVPLSELSGYPGDGETRTANREA